MDSFGRDDLLLIAKVANQAHTWIYAQSKEKDKADEVDLLDDYKAIRRDITKLNKLAAENITDTEMLKELDAERLDLMRELNDSVRKLEKRSELFKRD